MVRIQLGDMELKVGDDPLISPWNHAQLKTVELRALMSKDQDAVKKAYDDTMELVKVTFTRYKKDRERKMLLFELRLSADIWTAKICFIDTRLKSRQEVIESAGITMDYYNQAVACYQFAT